MRWLCVIFSIHAALAFAVRADIWDNCTNSGIIEHLDVFTSREFSIEMVAFCPTLFDLLSVGCVLVLFLYVTSNLAFCLCILVCTVMPQGVWSSSFRGCGGWPARCLDKWVEYYLLSNAWGTQLPLCKDMFKSNSSIFYSFLFILIFLNLPFPVTIYIN